MGDDLLVALPIVRSGRRKLHILDVTDDVPSFLFAFFFLVVHHIYVFKEKKTCRKRFAREGGNLAR